MADQQAGWYPDPAGDTSKLRYWDGTQWTNDFTDAQAAAQPAATVQPVASAQPAAQPTPQPAAQPVQPVQQAQPMAQPVQPVGQAQPYAQPGYAPQQQQPYAPVATQSNGLAIAALICGIAGLCFALPAIVAIITGVMGRKNPYNRGMATAGLILGIVGIVIWIFWIIFAVATGAFYYYY